MKKLIRPMGFAWFIKLSSLFKMSFIVGSEIAFFSAVSVVAPLTGAFFGISGGLLVWAMRLLMHVLIFKTISLHFLAFIVPGYCASLYWATDNKLVRIALPVLCMILFILHPVGSKAFIYSFYWLIPVGLYFYSRKTLFLEALGSTFIAHAVGSVIWLYTTASTAEMWLGLIPIVAVERIFFAMGMVVLYKIIVGCSNVKTSCVYYGRKSAMGNASRTISC